MAEIRKHRPQESAIGRAVREAMGESVQPITPGEAAAVDPFDPEATPSGTVNAVPGAASLPTFLDQSAGWLLVDAEQVQAISAPIRGQASPPPDLTDDPDADRQDTDDPDAGVV